MRAAVLDASVVGKLVFPEVDSEVAVEVVEELVAAGTALHAPGPLFVELANLGRKKVVRGEGEPRDARELLAVAEGLGFTIWPVRDLAAAGLEIGLETGVSAYDGLYLALAEHVDGVLVTADEELGKAPVSSRLPGRVRMINGGLGA